MTFKEFNEWMRHFSARFPTTGEWLAGMRDETIQSWFDDVFSAIELRDCLAINLRLMASGELAAYERERIPSIYIKACQDLAYARSQRSTKKEETKFLYGTKRAFTPVMRRVLNHVESEQRRYRQDNADQRMPDADRKELVNKYMAEWDQDDDETLAPRFKCLTCQDSGLVHFRDDKQRPMCGHCTCAIGLKRRDAFHAERRSIACASSDVVEWSH